MEIKILLADQYPAITSDKFQNYLQKENINLILTVVDSPFPSGLNERLNQTLINRLRCKINSPNENRAWTTLAHECVNEYN